MMSLHELDADSSVVSTSDDGSISSEGGSSTVLDSDNQHNGDRDEVLAKKESRAVFRLRVLVILVLLIAAILVSVVVYFMTHQGQTDQFETQYEGAALKIIEAFKGVVGKLGGISAIGVAMTAHSVDHNKTWPFVTLSSFQERVATARSQSGALFVATAPLVDGQNRALWENYSITDEDGWIQEGLSYQKTHMEVNSFDLATLPQTFEDVNTGIILATNVTTQTIGPETGPGPYLPYWQMSPLLRGIVNLNIESLPFMEKDLINCRESESAVIGGIITSPPGGIFSNDSMTYSFATLLSYRDLELVEYKGDPMSFVYLPVFDSFQINRKLVAIIMTTINWASYFEKILPQNTRGVIVVLENPCNGTFTYEIDGESVKPIGIGDHHDDRFRLMERRQSLAELDVIPDGTEAGITINQELCPYNIRVYPSQTFQDEYITSTPIVITFAVAMIFVFTAVMFFFYDRLVERRQRLVMSRAIKSSAIVASLFPKNVRDRLMQDEAEKNINKDGVQYVAPKHRLKSFLGGGNEDENEIGQKPIADLFPHTTILFADIAGFTAWSSTRDPTSVFVLLQSVYQAFDALAQRRKVFKVETIGDSYVAVTGVPEPQANHAIIMAKFAADCMDKMRSVTRELELSLGPGTGDLAMRFGMHSGPVTAGVLRGERSRFQLFGDSVNTAARMESTGVKNKIQASQATADLLIAGGKGHWVTPRKDAVHAKGKGVLETFWIQPSTRKGESVTSSSETTSSLREATDFGLSKLASTKSSLDIEKHDRLIDWLTELLKEYIKPIISRRLNLGNQSSLRVCESVAFHQETALEELAEVICLPEFDQKATEAQSSAAQQIEVSEDFVLQLRKYVAIIASMYRDNPFHNFEHACHVTMSTHKFIQRIATPDIQPEPGRKTKKGTQHCGQNAASQLHEYTHGITSDPVALFAVVYSALIHDVDHRGVSNVQLMKEEQKMAAFYKNQSVAEQNSLSLAWDLLMSKEFQELRRELFQDHEDLRRFRQVVVNVVLATDIFDKELNDLRKARWAKAFSQDEQVADTHRNNLRATIVIEHIIQASDVSHTMQHWHIYRKWNMKLFLEMTLAYRSGRMEADPSKFWYKGELGFFDNYIIPLAKKLKDCNVFGVSSDECLNYALRNRAEWEERGQQIVEQMLQDLDNQEVATARS